MDERTDADAARGIAADHRPAVVLVGPDPSAVRGSTHPLTASDPGPGQGRHRAAHSPRRHPGPGSTRLSDPVPEE